MKKNKKYVTIKNDGTDYRKMAEMMTNAGFKMNHATCRNQLIIAIETILNQMSGQLKTKITKKHIKNLLSSQDIHDDLSDVLYKAYKELQEESNKNE